MHNHDGKYPSRPGFEPGTPRLQAPVDTNEPSGPAIYLCRIDYYILNKPRLVSVTRFCSPHFLGYLKNPLDTFFIVLFV